MVGNSPFKGLGNRTGLLMDFLEHVVTIFTPFHRVRRQIGFPNGSFHLSAVLIDNAHRFRSDLRHVPLFQEDETLGHGQQGGDIRGDKVLANTDTDDQGGAAAGSNQGMGIIDRDHPQCISPLHDRRGGFDRIEQAFARCQFVIHLVNNDLGIRL